MRSIFSKCGWLFLLLTSWSLALQARTVEGVALPESIALEGRPLVLNGAGVRKKFFFDIYVAALYLPERSRSAPEILDAKAPWRMVMHFLYEKVEKRKLADAWEAGFAANLDAEDKARMQPRLDRFKALFPDLSRGREVWLDHLPGRGVRVTLDGRVLGTIEGADFARALLSVWLGPAPVTRALKDALLGKG